MNQVDVASRVVDLVRELALLGARFVVFEDCTHDILLKRKEAVDDLLGARTGESRDPVRLLLDVCHCGLSVFGVPVGYVAASCDSKLVALSGSVSVGSFGTVGDSK